MVYFLHAVLSRHVLLWNCLHAVLSIHMHASESWFRSVLLFTLVVLLWAVACLYCTFHQDGGRRGKPAGKPKPKKDRPMLHQSHGLVQCSRVSGAVVELLACSRVMV